jgi:molybdopterin converting factor small subunit
MSANINIEVRLFATLRELLPPETRGLKAFQIPSDSTIDSLLDMVGIEDKITLILMINGRREKNFNKVLIEGDRVAMFPPVGGG